MVKFLEKNRQIPIEIYYFFDAVDIIAAVISAMLMITTGHLDSILFAATMCTWICGIEGLETK